MNKPVIDGFDNRGTEEHPYGFIVFTDGLRVGYAPGTRDADEDGLLEAHQPYELMLKNRRPGPRHYTVARDWAKNLNAALRILAEADAETKAAVLEAEATA